MMFVSAPKDCFDDTSDEGAGNADTTCPPQLSSPQPTLPMCITTETAPSTNEVTTTSVTTITVESLFTETHYTTVTASYTMLNVSLPLQKHYVFTTHT